MVSPRPPSDPLVPSDSARTPGAADGTDDTRVRVHVFVEGRVQGVWFRDSAGREAVRLGVRGWVRNLSDGRVEAIYEGPRDAVEEMIAWTNHGPDRARVTRLQIEDEAPRGETGFSVR